MELKIDTLRSIGDGEGVLEATCHVWTGWIHAGKGFRRWTNREVLFDFVRPHIVAMRRYKNYDSSNYVHIDLQENVDESIIRDAFVADVFAYKFYFNEVHAVTLENLNQILFSGTQEK